MRPDRSSPARPGSAGGRAFGLKIFSHRDDVTLANQFGAMAHGWEQVSAALDYASSRMRDGKLTGFERITGYQTAEQATIF